MLTDSSFETLTISKVFQIFITLEFFFNKKIDFSLVGMSTYLNAIHYSLIQAGPSEAANMLAKLAQVGLLNEANLGSLKANFKLDITLLAYVIHKLSLNEGTDSLLTQTNLDKLLEILKNSELTLEFIAKFIQVDDESKALTQERFDLAIILNKLLTRDNFKLLIDCTKDEFEKNIFPVLSGMHKTGILSEENYEKFMITFLNARIYDVENGVDSANSGQSSKPSFTDKLCMALMKFLSQPLSNIQAIFNRIIDGFNKITKRYETNGTPVTSSNSFFKTPLLTRSEDVNSVDQQPSIRVN